MSDIQPIWVLPPDLPDLTTLEGFKQWAEADPLTRPAVPTTERWRRMTPQEKSESGAERIAWFSLAPPIETPTFQRIAAGARHLLNLNAGTLGPRAAMSIDAPPGAGKSTLLSYIGRQYWKGLLAAYRIRGIEPTAVDGRGPFVPVASAEVLGNNPKDFLRSLAGYYALDDFRDSTSTGYLLRIKTSCRAGRTTLLLIDDVQYLLDLPDKSRATVFNMLKKAQTILGATIIYAGHNLKTRKFYAELRAAQGVAGQLAGRVSRVVISPYRNKAGNGRTAWRSLVRSMEQRLLLLGAAPGFLDPLCDYLYDRTGGYVGSLGRLLGEGMSRAVETGTEKLDEKLLNSVDIDFSAEERYAETRKKRSG
jgi:hypothetical protein